MYSSHSKDINRNKSFHPLTAKNLRRVEVQKEKEEGRAKSREERQKELEREKEEARYLALAGSEGAYSAGVAKDIFAGCIDPTEEKSAPAPAPAPTSSASTSLLGSKFLKHFVKGTESDASADAKRRRDESMDEASSPKQAKSTGALTASEALRQKREKDTHEKNKIDPLRRKQAYQNSVVVAAAKRVQSVEKSTTPSSDGGERRLNEAMLKLIQLKKQR